MDDEELQRRLKVLFNLIEEGRMTFSPNVPYTLKAIKNVKKLPDGSFDLSTVEAPVRVICNTINEFESLKDDSIKNDLELPPIDLPELSKDRINEDHFMEDIIEASNIVAKYLVLVSSIHPTKKLDHHYQGVIMGHMVRLYKLFDSFLYLTVDMRSETATIMLRCIVDTGINLSFLLEEDEPEIIKKYMKSSLTVEKKLWDQIHERKGETLLPIEKRMLDSVQATFKRAEIEIDSVTGKDMKWCGSTYDKALKTDMISLYENVFRGCSHNIHGTWHDLEFNHIYEKDGNFKPLIEYTRPRPQSVEVASIICLIVTIKYLNKILDENSANLVRDNLNLLIEWFLELQNLHESWIQKNRGN